MSDIEIAQKAKMKRIVDLANEQYGIESEHLEPYGHYKAKLSLDYIDSLKSKPNGKLILTTAISPTPAGEGKTTTTVGLGDAMNRIGKKTMICLREPSLGPCFGVKGGAAGGGYAQIVPMEDINLHFTGDFHAITSAHNLLSAMVDNHINHGNTLNLDPRLITWKRVLDMNDRALRKIINSLGGVANGFPREDGFDITVASEVMAIFCLATSLDNLKERLGNIVVGYTRGDRKPVHARELNANGAMAALLKDAIKPNFVQTLENNLAIVHGGPFANIAHGCNSVSATQAALKLADYVITEAGFGADLGAEKFFDIKCRKAGLEPSAVVLVATIRALKYHGGVDKDQLNSENLKALEKGMVNLERHFNNMQNCKKRLSGRWEKVLWFVKDINNYVFNLNSIRVSYITKNDKRLDPEGGRNPTDVWYFDRVNNMTKNKLNIADIPTMYPKPMIERIIKMSSKKGDTILDPFVGSGTTLIVAETLSRKGIGIDIDKKYKKVIDKRLKSETKIQMELL